VVRRGGEGRSPLLLPSCSLVHMDDCAEAKVSQTCSQPLLTVRKAIAVRCALIVEVCRGLDPVILLVRHGCDFGWGWLGKKVATEKLPPQEEAIGLETPAFDRLLPRRVSIRAKKLCPKIRSQSVRRASWRFFFFFGTMGGL
jgi:hypothetical protein